ncbi:MAG TPA: cytochrome c oxidase assembly protein [Acidimicrobiia bacterium]|jgi:putative membrane protein
MPAVAFPSWTAHPDVWLIVGVIGASYAIAVTRLGPRLASVQPVVTRFQVVCFSLGLGALWLASDWPIHDIAERYNYSIHMVQHLVFSMVAAPLLLLGTPAWLMRWLLGPSWLFKIVRWLARFLPALIVFNVVLVLTHWPWMVNESLRSGLVHFSLHTVLFLSSLIVWLPVLSPLPEIPRLQPILRILYLFAWSIVPTVPASFLTFGSSPLYKFYEHVPHLFGLTTLEDQQLAGLIMKLGAGLLLWLLIAVVFFRWAAEEEKANTPRHGLAELDRELTELGMRG